MPSETIGVELKGELARAFMKEYARALTDEGYTPKIGSKAALARAAIVEYLRARGYDVEDEMASWGGSRFPDQEDESQAAAVGAG